MTTFLNTELGKWLERTLVDLLEGKKPSRRPLVTDIGICYVEHHAVEAEGLSLVCFLLWQPCGGKGGFCSLRTFRPKGVWRESG